MEAHDIIQLVISGLGVLVTILIIWVASQKASAVIEERLKSGDKRFDVIEQRCKEHSEKLEKIEIALAVDHHRTDKNCEEINRIACQVAKLEADD